MCTKKIEILIVIDWSKLFSDKSDEGTANWIFKRRFTSSNHSIFDIEQDDEDDDENTERQKSNMCSCFPGCPEGGIDRLPMGQLCDLTEFQNVNTNTNTNTNCVILTIEALLMGMNVSVHWIFSTFYNSGISHPNTSNNSTTSTSSTSTPPLLSQRGNISTKYHIVLAVSKLERVSDLCKFKC